MSYHFVLNSSDSAPSTQSILRYGVRKEGYAGGVILTTSRLHFDPVGKLLKPTKFVGLAKTNIEVEPGKPKLVAWY